MQTLTPDIAEQSGKRAIERCHTLSKISEMDNGILRQYLTEEHKRCNQVVADWMTDAGMTKWQDEVGNQWGRLESKSANAKRLIVGSHLDTVPNAGAYDGILGVMLGIELAELINSTSLELPFHLDVVGFCDEEGTRFATTLIGSKALANEFDPQWLDITDNKGISMAQAMEEFGLDPSKATDAALLPESLLGYWEVHIEQGPVLEDQQQALGIVTAIAGAKRAMLEFIGQSGHAGTTPMHLRQDSLVAASELILAVEQLASDCKNGEVATVGFIDAKPGATNVISGKTVISLDVRAQKDADLDILINKIQQRAEQIAKQRKLKLGWQWTHAADAVDCDENIMDLLQQACSINEQAFNSGHSPKLPSGAGHDAMAVAPICPMGMLFIRSPGGISHHPSEAVIEDDVTKSIAVLYTALFELQKKF
jgi:allantoate deiminase